MASQHHGPHRRRTTATCASGSLRLLLLVLGAWLVAGGSSAALGTPQTDPPLGKNEQLPVGGPPAALETPPWGPDPARLEAAAKAARGAPGVLGEGVLGESVVGESVLGESVVDRLEGLRWHQAPTPEQERIDALAYDLDLAIDPSGATISGQVKGLFRLGQQAEQALVLDLADELAVSAVSLQGEPAPWTQADDRLTIDLGGAYAPGDTFSVVVAYGGTPPAEYNAFVFTSHNGLDHCFSFSEPFGARSWWPCDDWPADKADSVSLRVAVPHGLVVASNGTLCDVTTGAQQDIYHWRVRHPITTYLVSVAVYPYAVSQDQFVSAAGDTMPLLFYDFPDHAAGNAQVNALVPEMIDFFSNRFGPFPYLDEKYGHAEMTWAGGMEHQTCSSIGTYTEAVVAHELAHQWWGDLVTCADFHHIWLNEGFAVYAEALWLEHAHGHDAFLNKMDSARYYGSGTVYVDDLSSWHRIFDVDLTYHKAAWVLHMLRHLVGDDLFFPLLNVYRAAFADSVATTEDFRDLAESVTGHDLDTFFQQWIYEEYFPVYSYSWDQETPGELVLLIEQLQTETVIFQMPIDVRVHLTTGETVDLVVDNREMAQQYTLSVPAPVDYVELDPDGWILRRIAEPIEAPAFDQSTLLVNGFHWGTYGQPLRDRYEQRAFWGDLEIDFWDCFGEPAGGYPSTLPSPLGHGRVPSTVLGRYRDVIWLGNDWFGDHDCWINTSIQPYVESGGNLLLMTRHGAAFVDEALRAYLGITWSYEYVIESCQAVHEPLIDMQRTGNQSPCPLFLTDLSQETSTLLFVDPSYAPDRGVGVLRAPDGGGSHNPQGGRLAFVSGRADRWRPADLAPNVEAIVGELFAPDPARAEPAPSGAARAGLSLAAPALAQDRLALRLTLPVAGPARLDLYDPQGRCVGRLLNGPLPAGPHEIVWDGRPHGGALLHGGIYYLHLEQAGKSLTRRLIWVR